jgi:hypothetical protein
MATEKQLKALKKARAYKRRSKRGLAGITASNIVPSGKSMLNTFKTAGLMLIGFVGGREVSRKFIKNDDTGFKRYLGSILQAGGGIILANQKNEMLKYIGFGLVGSGVVEGVSKAMNKDILADGILNGISLGNLFSNSNPALPTYNPNQFMPMLPNLNVMPVSGVAKESDVIDSEYSEVNSEQVI